MIEEYLDNNTEICSTFDTSDITRLQGDQHTSILITINEIQATIRTFTNDPPGETNINKSTLKNLPESALLKLQWLFNHTLSMGYFPKKLKSCNHQTHP